MEDNKSEQYTFSENEKEILAILGSFESELEEKLQESKGEVERIKYYEKFQMQGIDFSNIFITTEKDVEGNVTYHVYSGDSSNELLSVDSEGKINIKNKELELFLDDIDLEKTMEDNEKQPGNLKGISEKMDKKDIEKISEEKQNTDEQKDEEEQQIEEDLKEQGEDLQISKSRKITDKNVAKRMPEVFGQSENNYIAYSNKLNRFVMISKENGEYQLNDSLEPAKMTWKSIISVESDGKQVERKVPYALMKMPNNTKKEVAVTIDSYGYIDIETVDVLPCQERIAREVRTEGEDIREEESYEVRTQFETEGKEYKHDIAHNVEKIEDTQRQAGKEVDYSITPEDAIPNVEPKMTWGDLMEKTGESLPKLIERYNRETANGNKDPQQAIETIESDYENVQHEHQRNNN